MSKGSVLHLNLKRKYFDAIALKKKRIEYRSRSAYWKRRLEGRDYDVICFRNGYSRAAPEMLVQFRKVRRSGRDYAISLGRVLKIKRWRVEK